MTTSTLPHPSTIRIVDVVAGNDRELKAGLIAWLTLSVDGTLLLDGITVRRTVDGRYAVSFPLRTDPRGNRHTLIRPVDPQARARLEREILTQLGYVASTTGGAP